MYNIRTNNEAKDDVHNWRALLSARSHFSERHRCRHSQVFSDSLVRNREVRGPRIGQRALLLLALSLLTFHTQHKKSAVRRANHHVPMYRESLSVIGSKLLPLMKFRFAEINIIQVPQLARRKIKQTYPYPVWTICQKKGVIRTPKNLKTLPSAGENGRL